MNFFEKLSYMAIEVNSFCNLQCLSCNRERLVKEGKRPPKNMSLAEVRNILDQVKDCPIDTIKFQILSEPMFHPEFEQIVKTAKEYFPKVCIIVATNLQYDLPKTPFLKMLPYVDIVYLSIDGVGETYERLRKGANYKKLLQSLGHISTLINDEDRKKLHINFTLTPENYKELPEVYKLRDQFKLPLVRINLAQNWNEEEFNSYKFTDEILDELQSFAADIRGVAGWQYKDCYWPFSGLTIDVYGDVRQCIINTTQTPLGNVFQKPLKSIFNDSPEFNEIRKMLSQNQAPKSCLTCDYKFLAEPLKRVFAGLDKDAHNSARKKAVDVIS